MQEQQHERPAAGNQALFREVNDRVKELNEIWDALMPYGEWVCECYRLDCVEPIRLTLDEYEALRSRPRRFAVAPDDAHLDLEAERVVERTVRYWIVEKFGAAGERAAELDHQAA